jgi:hypothetical protein
VGVGVGVACLLPFFAFFPSSGRAHGKRPLQRGAVLNACGNLKKKEGRGRLHRWLFGFCFSLLLFLLLWAAAERLKLCNENAVV